MPTREDVLRSRIRTTGIYNNVVRTHRTSWCLVDTGGERSERKKWIHCFLDVAVVLFVVALSDYNKFLVEDGITVSLDWSTSNSTTDSLQNRMSESLQLFDAVVNSRHFTDTLIVRLFGFVSTIPEINPSIMRFSYSINVMFLRNSCRLRPWRTGCPTTKG